MAKKEKETKTNNKQKRHYFKDMKAELKKVIWPTAKQTANNTVAVIVFTLAIAIIVFVLDVVFDFANKKGVVTLQDKIKTSYSANNSVSDENTSSDNTEENSEDATNVEVESNSENSTNTDSKE